MRLQEVGSQKDIRAFLELPTKIYNGDPHWIRPLNKDIEDVFDENKNKMFKTGNCKRWLLKNEQGEIIGRIAAFVNNKYKQDQPTGGIGFFECINDQTAANFMFDHCKKWLQEQGMEAMDGPINFGERDRWWGLVVEGYFEPLYCMNYNPPYYKNLFENYGFQVYFYQNCFGMKVELDFQEKWIERHRILKGNKNLSVKHIEKRNLDQFAKDFCYVYNKAWAGHGGGKTLDERVAIKMFHSMKPIMDEKITWFAYHKDEPIACWINLPDLNQYFKKLNGQFAFFHKLKFLYYKTFLPANKLVGIVFGIVPEWQGKGIDNYMIIESSNQFVPLRSYKNYEMQWIGDFNPKMINIAKSLGSDITRQLATYRYLFDRSKTFERHPIL